MWCSKRRCSRIVAKTAAASLALALIGTAPLALANDPDNGPSHCGWRQNCWNWQRHDNDDWRWRDHDRDHDNDRYSRPYYYSHGPSYYYSYPSYY